MALRPAGTDVADWLQDLHLGECAVSVGPPGYARCLSHPTSPSSPAPGVDPNR